MYELYVHQHRIFLTLYVSRESGNMNALNVLSRKGVGEVSDDASKKELKPLRVITLDELSQHSAESVDGDRWISIDGHVLDVSSFLSVHPAGSKIILALCGTDATDDFFSLHRLDVLKKYASTMQIGVLERSPAEARSGLTQLDVAPSSAMPYAESMYFEGLPSANFSPEDVQFKNELRAYFDTLRVRAAEYESSGRQVSDEVFSSLASQGLLACFAGPGAHMTHAKNLPAGLKPEAFSYRHEVMVFQERARLWAPGFEEGISSGINIGLPAVVKFGPRWMESIVKWCVRGSARICLAITEPFAGSDVAGLRCSAVENSDGTFTVNGVKKWITGGCSADYFVTAVKSTSNSGNEDGVSLLLIERSKGVTTTPIKTLYSSSASTALVVFDNVVVPARNLIGKQGKGFKLIMHNFNKERVVISAIAIARCRMIVEECFKWTSNRNAAGGKKLLDFGVVAQYMGEMIAEVEAVSSWFDSVVYAMDRMSFEEINAKLGSRISLLKFKTTRVCALVADRSANLLGGRAVTKTGLGTKIETFQRVNKFAAIYGGAEEIMTSLGVKLARKSVTSEASRM